MLLILLPPNFLSPTEVGGEKAQNEKSSYGQKKAPKLWILIYLENFLWPMKMSIARTIPRMISLAYCWRPDQ